MSSEEDRAKRQRRLKRNWLAKEMRKTKVFKEKVVPVIKEKKLTKQDLLRELDDES